MTNEGCAATCLYDGLKVVLTRFEGGDPVYNARFLAFATHYGFRPWACRPHRPQTKGKVERPFHYVERNLLNGRTFQSLAHLNEVTREWLKDVADVRLHRETQQTPWERYQAERAHLIPLPAQPYDTAEVVYRCVSGEGLIVYCQNRYSVPWRYLGLMLPVRIACWIAWVSSVWPSPRAPNSLTLAGRIVADFAPRTGHNGHVHRTMRNGRKRRKFVIVSL